jgi:hypothetical protein
MARAALTVAASASLPVSLAVTFTALAPAAFLIAFPVPGSVSTTTVAVARSGTFVSGLPLRSSAIRRKVL